MVRLFQFGLLVLLGTSLCGCSLGGFCSPFNRTSSSPLSTEETVSYVPQQREEQPEELKPIRMDEPIKISAPDTSQSWSTNSRS